MTQISFYADEKLCDDLNQLFGLSNISKTRVFSPEGMSEPIYRYEANAKKILRDYEGMELHFWLERALDPSGEVVFFAAKKINAVKSRPAANPFFEPEEEDTEDKNK